MSSHYPEVVPSPDFAKQEEEILEFWHQENIFWHSVNNRPTTINQQNNEYVFYDGPPFANGLPHYGHLLTGFKKDVTARYQTMQGKRVERRFGWDCHGLPAEMATEKELKLSGRSQIIEYGVDKFNQACEQSVLKHVNDWQQYVTRQARWVDFENSYKTMDISYMESVIWGFSQLYKKGLIYQAMKVMPYSWACQTPLSNFETRMDNAYRLRTDKSVTVSFLLKHKPQSIKVDYLSYRLLAWTTTPWTLPANLALAINPTLDYSYIIKDDHCYIIASNLLNKYSKEFDIETAIAFEPNELVGADYLPIFSYFKNQPNSFKILAADFVTDTDGTGIVHLAPGFGEEDQLICNQYKIELVCPVDDSGRFTNQVTDFANQQVFEAIDNIIKQLKINGNWFKTEQFIHNYPHCWRTDTPLIYKAVPSWYVNVTQFRDRMLKHNQAINWLPNHIKDGLFGNWLENAKDWSISRNRFWGTPLPVWISDDPNYPRIDVYGSIAELEADFNVKVHDMHRPFIDQLSRPNPDDPTGKSTMRRIGDVFDCWFESGSMPFAQVHYPFENKEWFENHFPADFICEYIAQTRGWFYTLMVLSTALFDRPPFLNCVCHGVILDAAGQKLSKRLNNYADPMTIFNNYGSDALRFLMMSSSVMRAQELLIDKEGNMIKDILRLSIKPIWNAYNFFTLYANIDSIQAKYCLDSTNIMDQYILSKLKYTVETIKQAMNNYDSITACNTIDKFFEVLTNWYIRRNRARFWQSDLNQNKQSAYDTLYTTIITMCKASAPLLPLLSEEIYLGLMAGGKKIAKYSVHLADFPVVNQIIANDALIASMDKVRSICSAALSIRSDENIRVRQPLAKLQIISDSPLQLEEFSELIKDEINVKQVEFSNDLAKYAVLKPKINFAILGKRLPDKIKTIISELKANNWQLVEDKVQIAGITLQSDEVSVILESKETQFMQTINNNILILLDPNISFDLKQEGIARDVIRIIQQARKNANLNITDRIKLSILSSQSEIESAIIAYNQYIEEQTLSVIEQNSNYNFFYQEKLELDNNQLIVKFSVI